MTRRLVLSYLAIAVFVLVALEIPLGVTFARSQRDRLTVDVERDAVVVASLVEDQLQSGAATVDPGLGDYPERTGGRVVITDGNGISVFDSADPDRDRRDFSTRPEIADALTGGRAIGTRRSDTLDRDLLYVAVPVASGGVVHGAVRLTFPTEEVDRRIARNWWLLAVVAAVVLAATAVVGWMIARWVTGPTRKVEHAAAAVAGGDLTARAPTGEGPPEVRELARGFNRMAERLDTLIRAQRDFVADASHQLRSPLTALRLELEDLPVRPDGVEGRDRALAEAQRLGRLVDGLLVLARPGSGQRLPEPNDVTDLVAARLAVWRPLADESAVDLTMDGGTAAPASVVPDHLEQILDNLIANALEVSPPGGTVRVSVDADHDVRIRVRDHGPGMTSEQRARAFDRFWRGPEARAGTGSGLGLAIARELARASGGDIELDAAPGGGLEATIVLPAA